jgi:glycosyltransferase involved in cell wall biosynthesis
MKIVTLPKETAGQAWDMTIGLRSMGIESELLTRSPHQFGYPSDSCLNITKPIHEQTFSEKFSNAARRTNAIVKRLDADVFNFWCGAPLAPAQLGQRVLGKLGKTTLVTFNGSEVRLKSLAEKNNPYTHPSLYARPEADTRAWLEILSGRIDAAVVMYPELEEYAAEYFDRVYTVARTVDVINSNPSYPDPELSEPYIVHAPSKRDTKGTESIIDAVESLESEYSFDFKLLEKMPNSEVKKELEIADIVIGGLRTGTFGVLSLEGMARGAVALAYMRSDLLDRRPNELPIVNTNPKTIEETLEDLLQNPELLHDIGKQSRAYVESHHERTHVIKQWIAVFNDLGHSLEPALSS